MEEARAELVKLQAGDPENLALWRRINAASLAAFQQIYDRLGIRFDHTLGESFYNDKVERVYRELAATGISSESQGAQVVFHPEHPRFKTQPLIVRKSDGAANYATTDLATILYRARAFPTPTASSTWSTSASPTTSSSSSSPRAKWFARAALAPAQAGACRFRDRPGGERQAAEDPHGRQYPA